MKIIVDCFGGDNAPLAPLKGAEMAVKEYNIDIILCGDEEKIKKCAQDNGISLERMEIIHTDKIFDMHDNPKDIIKSKIDTSLGVAMKALADGKGDALVSAGSTGAIVVGGTFIVKREKGIKRPALASSLPTKNGSYFLMDIGANSDCRPEMLLQFAFMASAYAEKVLKIENPTVGLVNIGTEDTKGGELQLSAYKLLKEAPINFIGNVEARDLPAGVCDVAIADGFTGNIILKLTEGVALTMFRMLKDVFKRNFVSKIAAALMMPGLKVLKSKMDYSAVGGALLMGVSKPVIKAHGSSNEVAFKNAIGQAVNCADADISAIIAKNMKSLKSDEATEE